MTLELPAELRPRLEEVSRNGSSPDGLPAIRVSNRPMREVTGDAQSTLEAANDPPQIFVRGGALTRVRRDEHERPIIEPLGESQLRGQLARVANFLQVGKGGDTHTAPPLEIVRDLLAIGTWPFPALEGVTETPALRTDGTVITDVGYDPASRLVYLPSRELSLPAVPHRPSDAERKSALALLDETVEDFPFVDAASRANALALLLTPIMRPAIAGQVPLALIDATKAGTGKGMLASLAAQIATGRPAAVLAAPSREEEWAKTLLAALLRGAAFIVLDEAEELRSVTLAAALTAATYEGRVLGRSETVQLPQRATWAAAGNNIRLGGDLARRCYWIRLDAKVARPWQRRGFRHPDLLSWAAGQRGELLCALLTLARSWYAAGRPLASVPPLGGFTEWASTIGGVLAHAGVSDFLGNLEQLYSQADEDASAWEAFLACWTIEFADAPVTVAEVTSVLEAGQPLRDALPEDLAGVLDKGSARFKAKLGKALGKRVGTRYGDQDWRVERAGQDSRSGAFSWRVLSDDSAGVQGSQGSGGYSYARPQEELTWSRDANTPATPAPLHEGETGG